MTKSILLEAIASVANASGKGLLADSGHVKNLQIFEGEVILDVVSDSAALAQKKRFPGLLSMFARLGEQTGQLPLMLQRAAHQLSTEVQRKAMQLATLLEPLLIVAMGAVVMLIVLAVLLPIIEMNQLVR